MKKSLRFPLLLAALFPLLAAARPVAEAEAAVAAANWLARTPRPLGVGIVGAAVSEIDVRTVLDENGDALFYAAVFPDGGVVFTSAETGIAPIIAFSDSDCAMASGNSPLREILAADIALRAEQVRNAESKRRTAASCAENAVSEAESAWDSMLSGKKYGRAYISDMRVPPLLKTAWGQGDDENGSRCANYYTPNGYVCGCVALAGAQIARFWRFPTASRPSVQRTCYVSGRRRTYDSIGGTYSWNLMPETFVSPTPDQREAIGKLCYDFGVATYMDWGRDGSGTGGFCLDDAFTTVFGYANSRVYVGTYGGAFSQNVIGRTVFANLDAGCPVSLGIDGHEVVADGYGYVSGKPYTHLNMGWRGEDNAWYNLPTVDSDTYKSTVLDEVVYNIFPEKTGDLLTGRVLDETGRPVMGATVVAGEATATTDSKGIFALRVEGGATWTVEACLGSLSAINLVYVTRSVSSRVWGETASANTGTPGNSWGNDMVLPGTVVPQSPDPLPVYRFYSKAYKGHFFTIDEEEKQNLIDTNPNWRYEGTAYKAYTNEAAGTTALYRFYSKGYHGHFFTIDADEAETVMTNPNWRYEGIAYYVYPAEVEGSVSVFRFWSKGYRHHFYTTNVEEKDNLIATNPNWKYEGVAFYALPADGDGVGEGVGVGQGEGVGEGQGEGEGGGEGVGQGEGRGEGRGEGVGQGEGRGEGVGEGVGQGEGRGEGVGVGEGVGQGEGRGEGVGVGQGEGVGEGQGEGEDEGERTGEAPWTLMLRHPCPGRVLAVPDVADLGEVAVETSDTMAAPLAIFAAAATMDDDYEDDAELRLTLPDGVFTTQLWDGAGTLLDEQEAEGAFDFALPASGVWHSLIILDADGEEVFSIWLRAE